MIKAAPKPLARDGRGDHGDEPLAAAKLGSLRFREVPIGQAAERRRFGS